MDFGVLFLLCGSFVGAGFVSGEEINQFFLQNSMPLWGFLLSITIALILLLRLEHLISHRNITSLNDLLNHIFPPTIARIYIVLLQLFLFATLVVMVSASGSLGEVYLGVPKIISLPIVLILLYLISKGGVKALAIVQKILVPPLLIIVLITTSIYIGRNSSINQVLELFSWQDFSLKAVLDALIYASYNVVGLMLVLLALGKRLVGRSKEITVFALILGALGMLILVALELQGSNVYEIPSLYLARSVGEWFFFFYSVALFLALFTTALAELFALLDVLDATLGRKKARILILILALPLAFTDFPVLMKTLYSLFAIIFLPMLIRLLFR